MSKKDGKHALTNDELLAQFDELNVDNQTGKGQSGSKEGAGEDVIEELANLASQRPTSRPGTPGRSSPSNTKRPSMATPPPDRSSEDKSGSRKSADSTRPYHTSMTPADTTPSEPKSAAESPEPQQHESSSGGGWWGGLFATASAAVKQAEAAVKEIQNNEEAQKWAEHVRGNVGALKGLGMYSTDPPLLAAAMTY